VSAVVANSHVPSLLMLVLMLTFLPFPFIPFDACSDADSA
jgi:hypothetical protein